MEAATIETKASNDQAWNAVNHSFYLVVEVSIFSLSLPYVCSTYVACFGSIAAAITLYLHYCIPFEGAGSL